MSGDVCEDARPGESAAQAVDPCVTSAAVVSAFWGNTDGGAIDAQAGYDAILKQVEAVQDGALVGMEATLVAQAIALNAIFADLAQRGQAALGRPGIAAERYLRLAMRAQTQCRMTLRELAELKKRQAEAEPPKVEPQKYTRIERVMVWPRYDADGNQLPPDIKPYGDWAAQNDKRESYGEGLDGGAARGLCADDEGAQGVGTFDRTPYG